MQTCNISCSVQMKDSSTQKKKNYPTNQHISNGDPWALLGGGGRGNIMQGGPVMFCSVLITRLTGSSYCLARAISCVLWGDEAELQQLGGVFIFSPWIGPGDALEGLSSTYRGGRPAVGRGAPSTAVLNNFGSLYCLLLKTKNKQTNKKNNFLCNICFWVLGFEIFWVVKPTPLVPVCWYFVQ